MLLEGILFDFDGLIVDTETSEFVTVSEAFAAHGLTLSHDEWVQIIGTADHPHWTEMLEVALGHPIPDRDQVLEDRRARHHALIALEPVRPGVVSLATAAREAGVGVAVASSSAFDWVDGHLRRLDLRDLFPVVVTRDDVGRARTKPRPDLFLLAAGRLGARPFRCVVLEDSAAGVEAGAAAGCTTVAVPNGMTDRVDFAHADHVVRTLEEVDLAALDELVRRPGGTAPRNAAGRS